MQSIYCAFRNLLFIVVFVLCFCIDSFPVMTPTKYIMKSCPGMQQTANELFTNFRGRLRWYLRFPFSFPLFFDYIKGKQIIIQFLLSKLRDLRRKRSRLTVQLLVSGRNIQTRISDLFCINVVVVASGLLHAVPIYKYKACKQYVAN